MFAVQSVPWSRESTPEQTPHAPNSESNLDPELADFCTRLNITPHIQEFHDDEDGSDSDHCASNKPSESDMEESLRVFIQAFRRTTTAVLKKENKKKRGKYTKHSRQTLQRHQQARVDLAAKGFLPLYNYNFIQLNENAEKDSSIESGRSSPVKSARMESEESSDEGNTPARDTCIHSVSDSEVESESFLPSQNVRPHFMRCARMESEEFSDEGNMPARLARDTCIHSVSGSEVESESFLPPQNVRLRLGHHARMESEESSGNDNESVVWDYKRRRVSENDTGIGEDEKIRTAGKSLEEIRHEAFLVHQKASQGIPISTFQLIHDDSRLQEASAQLTKEGKQRDHDVIVRTRIAEMIGLLNLYTDKKMKYTWKSASEVVAKMQGRGTNHARRIREWTVGFLKEGDLPLHQLNWTRPTLLDDEDIAEEIKSRMAEKVGSGFIKAEDVVEIVASPKMQAIFAQKGISKASISVKTAHRWLGKLGWTYGKLKNGMYLDGHERSDVVEYRQHFVERWTGIMGYDQRFHRRDHDGTELPRPNGFPVPGAIGRFRLILVTHDESTFFQNDERNLGWSHASTKSKPKAKGNGQSLMVSDFLTPDWGRLRDGDE
jgi:hypothetical protein